MFELLPFQETAVSQLIKQTRSLLQAPGVNKKCVFKAPTGSGKTIMVAEWLERLSGETWAEGYVFIWASLYDLHNQSRNKLANYLADSHYSLMGLNELADGSLPDNAILFVNWHSLTTQKNNSEKQEKEWANLHVKDREDGKSITNVLEKTRSEGKQTVLIVDEAHRNYLTANSQQFISEVFQPKLTIEVSATPILKIDPEDMVRKEAGFVTVNFSDAVASGLIKQETLINQNVGHYVELAKSADEIVIKAAIEKREYLADIYRQRDIGVNPLLLVQLPSESEKTSALDRSVREEVELILAGQGITYENGKLAVWLSEEKRHLELIEKNDSPIQVLIFKEAVAVGWDCPRAQILVMLRAIKSISFEIQTVGRILRMPEAKHYSVSELNTAFVFTNIASISIKDKPEELDFFKTKFSQVGNNVTSVELPSFYLHRQEYGDLTSSFSKILMDCLNTRFGISESDMVNDALEKADKELELSEAELQMPLLANVIVKNLDSIVEELGSLNLEVIQADVSDANIQKEFDYLLKVWSLPYAPVRSFTKIKTAFYKWFATLGYGTGSWNDIQRIVACSATNQKVLSEVIELAKEKYELQKPENLAGRKDISESTYKVPPTLMSGDKHQSVRLNKYAYSPAYLSTSRSAPEKALEEALESSTHVDWWLKNGEGQQQFLCLVYDFVDAESGLTRKANFFPDFIVKFVDGSLGIYETKSGITLTDYLTYAKSDALQAYIRKYSALNLRGGVVNSTSKGLAIFTKGKYTPESSQWESLVF